MKVLYPSDARQPNPKHHPASREELFEYGKTYAIYEEHRRKSRTVPKKRVVEVDEGYYDIIQALENAKLAWLRKKVKEIEVK